MREIKKNKFSFGRLGNNDLDVFLISNIWLMLMDEFLLKLHMTIDCMDRRASQAEQLKFIVVLCILSSTTVIIYFTNKNCGSDKSLRICVFSKLGELWDFG